MILFFSLGNVGVGTRKDRGFEQRHGRVERVRLAEREREEKESREW